MMSEIPLNKGSDLRVPFTVKDASKQPIDLVANAYSFTFFDITPQLEAVATLTPLDLPNGRLLIFAEWQSVFFDMTMLHFRIKVTLGSFDVTTRRIIVKLD